MVAAGRAPRASLSPDAARLSVRDAARLASTASPSAPPIMNDVLTTPEARPDSSGPTSLIAASSTGLNAMPAPKPSRIMLGSTSTTKMPSTGARAKSSSPSRREPEPDGERRPDAEAHHELRREPERERAHDQVRGQEREADLQRAVAEHELQVERRQEEPREHRRRPEHADDVRGRDVAEPEQAERHQRRRDARLDARRRTRSSDGRAAEQAERLGRRPAVLVAVDDRVDGEHQRGGDRHRARDVEPPAAERGVRPAAAAARARRRARRSAG